MALKPAEQQELEALEQQYGSVFEPPRPQPSFGQQLGRATVQALPEIGGLVGGALTTFGTRNPVLGAEARVGTAGVIRGLVGTGAGALTGTVTKQQIEAWGCKYHDLQVGNKPHFDVYICDKSFNSEAWFHHQKLHTDMLK